MHVGLSSTCTETLFMCSFSVMVEVAKIPSLLMLLSGLFHVDKYTCSYCPFMWRNKCITVHFSRCWFNTHTAANVAWLLGEGANRNSGWWDNFENKTNGEKIYFGMLVTAINVFCVFIWTQIALWWIWMGFFFLKRQKKNKKQWKMQNVILAAFHFHKKHWLHILALQDCII